MQTTPILKSLKEKKGHNQKSLAVLIDPDKINDQDSLSNLVDSCVAAEVDYFMVGGSLMTTSMLDKAVKIIKNSCEIPVVLFPGNSLYINENADAILFLSLISGRNSEFLIGQHVAAAPLLRDSDLEVISTGYMLVGDDVTTTAAYISQSFPIPAAKPEIAVNTALAGEMLGMSLIYMDAGSGAREAIPARTIAMVNEALNIPLIVGGGINTSAKAESAYRSGADILVIGTAVEEKMHFVREASLIRDQQNG